MLGNSAVRRGGGDDPAPPNLRASPGPKEPVRFQRRPSAREKTDADERTARKGPRSGRPRTDPRRTQIPATRTATPERKAGRCERRGHQLAPRVHVEHRVARRPGTSTWRGLRPRDGGAGSRESLLLGAHGRVGQGSRTRSGDNARAAAPLERADHLIAHYNQARMG